jgi:hypothetical protein
LFFGFLASIFCLVAEICISRLINHFRNKNVRYPI